MHKPRLHITVNFPILHYLQFLIFELDKVALNLYYSLTLISQINIIMAYFG